ncbi:hypothetical protein [Pedobacter sp.]|uniref:hypothetical protein n=1 Tax=Pedobacter sp. TaxID=1411316 RepID=UPI003D7F536D
MNWIVKFINLFKFKPNVRNDHNIRKVYYNLLLLIGLITVVILFSFYFFFPKNGYLQVFSLLAVMAAYYLTGCAVGFIFAIPKSAQGARHELRRTNSGKGLIPGEYYNDNTSLEEISDWLVKIIIGLSLTQFSYLRDTVESAASSIAAIFPCIPQRNECKSFFVFAYAVIIFYSIGGLIIGYLWTRIDFPKILTQSKGELELIAKLERQNKTMVQMINDPESPVRTNDLLQTQSFDDPLVLELVDRISETKPVITSSDVQKGRWGGKSNKDGFQLTATVRNANIIDLYIVTITVRSGQGKAFNGPVVILLPDFLSPKVRLLKADGQTEVFISVLASEVFTVAALVDIQSQKEYISLELDLNQVESFPESFYWKKS